MITNRIELAKHFAKLGFTHGAEIGVADGRYSEILCQEIPNLQKLYLVDPYAHYGNNWRSDDYQQKAYDKARERVYKYFAPEFLVATSLEVSRKIMDESLDFVFIDGAHDFDNVIIDIILWSKKVKKGGIVSGHDYYNFNSGGVIAAVNAYCEAHKIDLNLTLKDTSGHKDDICPCWWFVKE